MIDYSNNFVLFSNLGKKSCGQALRRAVTKARSRADGGFDHGEPFNNSQTLALHHINNDHLTGEI